MAKRKKISFIFTFFFLSFFICLKIPNAYDRSTWNELSMISYTEKYNIDYKHVVYIWNIFEQVFRSWIGIPYLGSNSMNRANVWKQKLWIHRPQNEYSKQKSFLIWKKKKQKYGRKTKKIRRKELRDNIISLNGSIWLNWAF